MSDIESIKRALLPPLRFAAKNDFAALDRLKNIGSLAAKVRRENSIPKTLEPYFERLENDFDQCPRDEKIATLSAFLGALQGDAGPLPTKKTLPKSTGTPYERALKQQRTRRANAERSPARVPEQEQSKTRKKRSVTRQKGPQTRGFAQPVETLPGVGQKRGELLRERGIHTVGDLLFVFPRTYVEQKSSQSLGELSAGITATVAGEVVRAAVLRGGKRSRFEAVIDDGSGAISLVFFRYSAQEMHRRFTVGAKVTATGPIAKYRTGLQMVHPRVQGGDTRSQNEGLRPVYPEVLGMHPLEMARYVAAAIDVIRDAPPQDPLPNEMRTRLDLCGFLEAILRIHATCIENEEDSRALIEHSDRAFRRLAFEELFIMQLAIAMRRKTQNEGNALVLAGESAKELYAEAFAFTPTKAQVRVGDEIFHDLEKSRPMSRMLQGDVGAGKTAVALTASLRAVKAGAQVAVMAPTEILARQHVAAFTKAFSPLGIRVGGFFGGMRKKERTLQTARLKNREIHVAVGTHALLSDDVIFSNLGLAIIDEQHRFGVAQRATLLAKGPRASEGEDTSEGALTPHLLVMTATPIPRSLALTYYGDTDISILDELPPGRAPIDTRVLAKDPLPMVLNELEVAIAKGERAYIVYPLIDESEKLDLADATRGFEMFCTHFGDDRCGLLHGKIKNDERTKIMRDFAEGRLDILVATTVIEVGVDIADATLMIIMHSERFGLSQLHQLRGRVGRSQRQGTCLLIAGGLHKEGIATGTFGKEAVRRLKMMEKSTDGFKIAEEDLAIRGPGDFLGTRQSGLPSLVFSDLRTHGQLIEVAKREAEAILEEDPELLQPMNALLRKTIEVRFAEKMALVGAT